MEPTLQGKRTADEAELEPSTQLTRRKKRHEDPEVDMLLDQILARNTVCRETVETVKALGFADPMNISCLEVASPVIGPSTTITASPVTLIVKLHVTRICSTPRLTHRVAPGHLSIVPLGHQETWFDVAPMIDSILADVRPERLAPILTTWKECMTEYAGAWAEIAAQLVTRHDELMATLTLFNLQDTPLDWNAVKDWRGYTISATLEPKVKGVSLKSKKGIVGRAESHFILDAAALLYTFKDIKMTKVTPLIN
jgi:hypothetical protein